MSRNTDEDSKYPIYHRSPYQSLPPIRDVFGDVLEQPARYRSASDNSDAHSSNYRSRRVHPNHDEERFGIQQRYPPLRSSSEEYAPSRHTATSPRESSRQSYQYSSQNTQVRREVKKEERFEPSNHSYDVFVSTSTQGLVHQRSSHKDDFHQTAKEEAISASTGKHGCSECGRRFEKLSHFKNHMNSHSGERPYQCPWPGCGKTFGASSNMRRHERTHGNGEDIHKPDVQDSQAMQYKWDSKFYPNPGSFYR